MCQSAYVTMSSSACVHVHTCIFAHSNAHICFQSIKKNPFLAAVQSHWQLKDVTIDSLRKNKVLYMNWSEERTFFLWYICVMFISKWICHGRLGVKQQKKNEKKANGILLTLKMPSFLKRRVQKKNTFAEVDVEQHFKIQDTLKLLTFTWLMILYQDLNTHTRAYHTTHTSNICRSTLHFVVFVVFFFSLFSLLVKRLVKISITRKHLCPRNEIEFIFGEAIDFLCHFFASSFRFFLNKWWANKSNWLEKFTLKCCSMCL